MNNAYDGKSRFYDEVGKRTREIKEALCTIRTDIDALQQATQQYNTNELFVVSDTDTLTFPANTYHSISFLVVAGKVNITEAGVEVTEIQAGTSGESIATTLLANPITFTGHSSGSKILIKTIK